MKLLVVEDNIPVTNMWRELFDTAGFCAEFHFDSDSAWKSVSENPEFRVGLLDLKLPGSMDGMELAARIKAARPLMILIAISAYWDVYSASEALRYFSDVHKKPPDIHAVIRSISHAFERAKRWRDF